MKFKLVIVLWLVLFLLSACRTSRNYRTDVPLYNWDLSVKGGGNWGGFIESTEVDAVSGATKTGLDIGIRGEYNIRRHGVESGADYLTFEQKIEYNDPANDYYGAFETKYRILHVPATFNLNLLRSGSLNPVLTLKAGVAMDFLLDEKIERVGVTPDHELKSFSFGPTLGLLVTPIHIDRFSAGAYFDVFRGSGIFEENVYHSGSGLGCMTHMQYGVMIKCGFY